MSEGYVDQIAALRQEIDELSRQFRPARSTQGESATIGRRHRQIDLDENTFRLSDPASKNTPTSPARYDELAERRRARPS